MADSDLSTVQRAPIRVGIVPHTHWDREWYASFETFRMRLVRLLDDLLPMLEADPSYARFLLDGQTAVLDDYLEIRPEAAAALHRLAASGRVSVGPWMVLMDEFMVSGETIVRDLQLGLARGAELGGAMPVGYLPDMFGHVAQMPQVLRLAGLEHAVAWRGIPAAIDRTGFWWEAPDGSRVRTEYLYGSYSNGRDLPRDAKRLVGRARDYEQELGPARIGDLLLMNGTDHQLPQPWLGRVVAEANAIQDDYRFEVTSLAEYLAHQPSDGLPTWRGELRSGARSNLLMGVASNRVDVHRACAAAERALERRAEPLSALLLDASEHPDALLDHAWRLLVLNSAHDSSCACSADEVVDEVLVRYARARQVGDGLVREALHRLAAEVDAPTGSTVVVNSTARDRGGVVEVTAPGSGPLHFVAPDGSVRPAQVLEERAGLVFSDVLVGRKVIWMLDLMRGPEFSGTTMTSAELREADDGAWDLVLHGAAPGDEPLDLGEVRERIAAIGAAGGTVRVEAHRATVRTALVDAGVVPGFGWTTLRAVDGEPATASVGLDTGDGWIANDVLRLEAAGDGTYAVTTADGEVWAGLGRLVDGGDGGDTYNYSPPTEDVVIDQPVAVRVDRLAPGPVAARLRIEADYDWPTHAEGDERSCARRSDTTVRVTVSTTLELRRGERFVRVRTELVNLARDHRLRAHFPLPTPVPGSAAECAFAVVHRGLTAEGGPQEHGLPTFPSRRFVDASAGDRGLCLVHDGLLEYEVTDGGRELALTLLRATGYLSRTAPALRPNPAGPADALHGSQVQGRLVLDYAVLPHRGDWTGADPYAAADEVLVPLERVRGGNPGGPRPAAGRRLRVDGAEVSAVRRTPGGLEVRAFLASEAPGRVEVLLDEAPVSGWVVDLRGRPVEPFDGGVDLAPWQIVTLLVRD